jgi:hypothetical protein
LSFEQSAVSIKFLSGKKIKPEFLGSSQAAAILPFSGMKIETAQESPANQGGGGS